MQHVVPLRGRPVHDEDAGLVRQVERVGELLEARAVGDLDLTTAPGKAPPESTTLALMVVLTFVTGVVDAEIDASLDKERSAPTLEERKAILQTETMPLLASKVPALSLFTSVMIHAMDKSLTGMFIYPDGSMDASKGVFA